MNDSTAPRKPQWSNPIHLLAFGFGSGAAPKAPGTFGTLAALPIAWLMQPLPLWSYALIVLVAFVVGVYLCDRTSKDLAVHDHPGIVWDEFVGLWIALFAAPVGWVWLVAGFLLFRLFDIWKPWPIGWLDKRVDGGLGIMLDDVVAGLFALGVLQGFVWYGGI